MTRRPVQEQDTVNSLFLLSKGKPTNESAKFPPSSVALAKDDSTECRCPSTAFAHSLKTFAWVEYKPQITKSQVASVWAVTSFDLDRYYEKCKKSSPDFDSTIDLEKVAVELFKPNEVWASRDLAYIALEAQSKCHGFTAHKKQNYMGCNRFGKPKEQDKGRSYAAGALLANCTMRMYMRPLSKERYKATVNAKKWSYRGIWTSPIELTQVCAKHGGDCVPSAQNRVATQQRAGRRLFHIIVFPNEM